MGFFASILFRDFGTAGVIEMSCALEKGKEILIICPYSIYPPESGGQKSIYYRALASSRLFHVTLLMPLPRDLSIIADVRNHFQANGIDVEFLEAFDKSEASLLQNFVKLLRSVCLLVPKVGLNLATPYNIRIAEALLETDQFDIIQLEHSYTFALFRKLRRRIEEQKIRVVCWEHNVEHIVAREAARFAHNWFWKLMYSLEAFTLAEFYRVAYSTISNFYYLSPPDLEYFRKRFSGPGLNLQVGDVLLPDRGFRDEARNENIILFSSDLNYYPNRDGLEWFLKEIFDSVLRVVPDTLLYVTGNSGASKANFTVHDNVVLTGHVPADELERLYLKAKVFISPLRFGSGIKFKVIEAMSYGVPVIGSSISFEGMDVTNYQDCIVSNHDADFAQRTIEVLRDSRRGSALGENGYEFFRKNYSMNASAGRYLSKMSKLVA